MLTKIEAFLRARVSPGATQVQALGAGMFSQAYAFDTPLPPGGEILRTQNATLVMLGDLACYMINMARLPWVTAYDVLPLITINTKRAMQTWLMAHDAFIITAHDPETPVGKLAKDAKGFVNVVAAQGEG